MGKKDILQPLDSISVVRLYQSVITRAHANSTLLFECVMLTFDCFLKYREISHHYSLDIEEGTFNDLTSLEFL